MSVSNTTVSQSYAGGGVNFAIPFDFEVVGEIVVKKNGVVQTYGAGNDYIYSTYVDGLPTVIQFNTTTLVTDIITITRDASIVQATVFADGDPTPLEEFERGLDRLTRRIQEVDYNQSRNVVLPEGGSLTELEMPEPESDKILGWNTAGTALENKTYDLTTIESRLSSLESRMTAAEMDIDDLEAADVVITSDIDNLEADALVLAGQISANTTDIGTNTTDIGNLEVKDTEHDTKIDNLESYFGVISKQTLLNNQLTDVLLTDLVFDGDEYDAIMIDYNIIRTTDSNYKGEAGTLHAICKGNGVWYLGNGLQTIDIAGVTFSIVTSAGKVGSIYYTSDDLAGTSYAGKINYRVIKFEV